MCSQSKSKMFNTSISCQCENSFFFGGGGGGGEGRAGGGGGGGPIRGWGRGVARFGVGG